MRKYEILLDILRQKASTLPSGSRLPSVRSLMQRYAFSLQTVNSALRALEDEGCITRRRGSGIYTQKKPQSLHVELHLPLFIQSSLNVKEFSVGRAVAEAGWTLGVRYHHPSLDDPADIPDTAAAAHIVAPEFATNRRTFFDLLLQQKKPLVLLGRQPELVHSDMVMSSEHQVFGLLVRHLADLGHRRFAFLSNEPDVPDIRMRRRVFADVLSIFGFPAPLFLECGTQLGELSSLRAYEAVNQFLAGTPRPLPFTALISASSSGALGAIRALHEAGCAVPRDCSVATFGVQPENALHLPSLTDAGTVAEGWGEAVVGILRRRFAGEAGEAIHVELPPHLNARETTGAVPIPHAPRQAESEATLVSG